MRQTGLRQRYPYKDWALDDFVQKAISLRSQGKSIEAVDLCMRGLDQYPLSIDLRCQLGLACFEKGDASWAKRELEEVVQAIQRNRIAFQILERIREQERTKGALRGHAPKRELETPSSIPFEKKTRTLADLYNQQGYTQEALEIYEELLRERPDDHYLKKMAQELTSKLGKTEAKQGQKRSMEKKEVGKSEVLDLLRSWQMAIQRRQKEKGFIGLADEGFRND